METKQMTYFSITDYKCDKCHIGNMQPTDSHIVLTSYPPKFEHKCSNCGELIALAKKYPYQELKTSYQSNIGNSIIESLDA